MVDDFFKKMEEAIEPPKEALNENLFEPFQIDGMNLNDSFGSLTELAKTGMEAKKVLDAINGEDRKEVIKELYEAAKHAA